jgi:hypothetical protein
MGFLIGDCLECGSRIERSDRIVRGHTVERCPKCRWLRLAGDSKKFNDGGGTTAVAALVARLAYISRDAIEARRWQEIVDSETDDPRWTVL